MFKLFNRSAKNEVVVAEPKADFKGKTTNQIIDEIHESFFTEVDRLLADAKILKSDETTKQDLISKYESLKKLGFENTKECVEAKAEIERLNNIKSENRNKESLVSAIDYFSFKYPNYKFITEESVKKICAKYNLIYGDVKRYIGTVPDKNLKHMLDFKIQDDDKCYVESIYGFGRTRETFISRATFEHYMEPILNKDIDQSLRDIFFADYSTGWSYKLAPLEIAAPLKDFNTQGMEVKDFKLSKIEIPDPVVLQPVFYNNQKHYLIVTAWGQEASDELVVNQKMN